MGNCGCNDGPCQCQQGGCGCGAQYGTGDAQHIDAPSGSASNDTTFSAEDIARMNRLFGEMDLTSAVEQEGGDLTEDDISWLREKFGRDGEQ